MKPQSLLTITMLILYITGYFSVTEANDPITKEKEFFTCKDVFSGYNTEIYNYSTLNFCLYYYYIPQICFTILLSILIGYISGLVMFLITDGIAKPDDTIYFLVPIIWGILLVFIRIFLIIYHYLLGYYLHYCIKLLMNF